MPAFTPYCGSPPVPESVHWNVDPALMGVLVAVAALSLWATRPFAIRRICLVAAGWLVLAFGFVSPLCNLSVALFSARVAQHMLFSLVAAPLVAVGLAPLARGGSPQRLAWACCAFMAALWFWHSPGAYDATLRDNLIYWAMHASTIAAAIWLWTEIFVSDALSAFAAVSITGLQMSALGAVLALSTRALFMVHAGVTAPWGLSQLEDQQLGGLIMWVPAGLLITAYSLVAFGVWLCNMGGRRAVWE